MDILQMLMCCHIYCYLVKFHEPFQHESASEGEKVCDTNFAHVQVSHANSLH